MQNEEVTIYGYSKCSTCRNAIKFMKELNYELEVIDLVESTPTAKVLEHLHTNSELPLSKFFNTAGQVYRSQNMKEKLPSMSEQEQYESLASNGMLIKRPIITDGTDVTLGFTKDIQQFWTEKSQSSQ